MAVIGERQARVFARFGLPVRLAGVDAGAVHAAMALDKKVTGGNLRWILLEDFGKPVIRDDVPEAVVREVLAGVLD